MQNIILILFVLLLTSCSSHLPKEVDIPIAVKQPAVKIPPKPSLPIKDLNANSKPNEIIKAYAISIQILEGYSDQLIKILEAYE